jgi:hypothetical protein
MEAKTENYSAKIRDYVSTSNQTNATFLVPHFCGSEGACA